MKAKKHTLNEEIGSWASGGGAMAGTDDKLGMSDETRQEIEKELANRAQGRSDRAGEARAEEIESLVDQPLTFETSQRIVAYLSGLLSDENFKNKILENTPASLAPRVERGLDKFTKEFKKVGADIINKYTREQSGEPGQKVTINETLGLSNTSNWCNQVITPLLLELRRRNILEKIGDSFDIVNETERDMSETLGYLNEFLPFSKEKMNYDRPVKIRFVSDQTNAGDVLGKTAHYNPSIDEIAVYVDERHPKDIMRSVSHELVHHSQNCRGEFDGATTLGEQPYMQTSEHLNEMERQAYEVGNMTFRIWEDNYKHTQRENKEMSINEKTVRAAVKEALMKRIKEVVVREPGDTSPLTPEEIKLFLAASGHTGVEVAPPGVSGADVEEVLPPGVTAADVAEMAPEEEEELEEYQDPCAELGRGIMDPATGECVEEGVANESTDREWYKSALNESLIKRFIK